MRKWAALILVITGILIISAPVIGGRLDNPTASKEGAPATTENRTVPVIVELFTSEGCSSCPPADALLAQLEKTQPIKGAEVIALEQHVDYWDHLGWRDPFSAEEFGARQGEYARVFGRGGVYTPQMIVNGRMEFPGGNMEMANRTIAAAAQSPKALVQLTLLEQSRDETRAGRISLSVNVEAIPAISDGDTAEVLLAVTESGLTTPVERGENAGRKLAHTGVVRSLKVIGSVDLQSNGGFSIEAAFDIERGARRENLRAVVFIQESMSRRILGAAAVRLN